MTECVGLAMASPVNDPPKSCVLLCGGVRFEHLILVYVTANGLLCTTSLLLNPAGLELWLPGCSAAYAAAMA